MTLILSLTLLSVFLIEGTQPQNVPVCAVETSNGTRIDVPDGQAFPPWLYASTPCGIAEQWPCFCDMVNEEDFIRCPYCGFLDINDDVFCARDGGSVEFVNELGQRVNCPCIYGSNSINLAPECTIISEGAPTISPATSPPAAAPVATSPPAAAPVATSPPAAAPVTSAAPAGTCGGYKAECSTGADCCSELCVLRMCQKRVPDTKNKLSSGRGGAGNVVKEGTRTLTRSSGLRGEE